MQQDLLKRRGRIVTDNLEGHKREAPRATSVLIAHNGNIYDLTKLLEVPFHLGLCTSLSVADYLPRAEYRIPPTKNFTNNLSPSWISPD